MSKFIVTGRDGSDFLSELCRQVGIDPCYARRIVLDFAFGEPGRMYVELYADNEALRVAFSGASIEVITEGG